MTFFTSFHVRKLKSLTTVLCIIYYMCVYKFVYLTRQQNHTYVCTIHMQYIPTYVVLHIRIFSNINCICALRTSAPLPSKLQHPNIICIWVALNRL